MESFNVVWKQKRIYNENQILTVPEYAEKWLDNFVKTGEKNI